MTSGHRPNGIAPSLDGVTGTVPGGITPGVPVWRRLPPCEAERTGVRKVDDYREIRAETFPVAHRTLFRENGTPPTEDGPSVAGNVPAVDGEVGRG